MLPNWICIRSTAVAAFAKFSLQLPNLHLFRLTKFVSVPLQLPHLQKCRFSCQICIRAPYLNLYPCRPSCQLGNLAATVAEFASVPPSQICVCAATVCQIGNCTALQPMPNFHLVAFPPSNLYLNKNRGPLTNKENPSLSREIAFVRLQSACEHSNNKTTFLSKKTT